MASPEPFGSASAAAPSQSDGAAPPGSDASPQIETLRAELDALRATVRQNDDEIDALQLQAAASQRPWYRSIEALVAVFALLLSLTTTVVSGYWAKSQNDLAEQRLSQQEIHDSRQELRGLLQAMSELERKTSEAMTQQADPLVAGALSRSYAAETSLLANQAYDVIGSIPDYVSSSEYVQVGVRMIAIYDYDRAVPMLTRAVETASNIYDYMAAIRTHGAVSYQIGQSDMGRTRFEQALNAWTIYPSSSAFVQNTTNFETELYWAQALLANGHCDEAPAHMDRARGYLNALAGPTLVAFQTQYNAVAAQVAGCVPNELASSAEPRNG